jgi:hypothetical protein
VLGALQRSSEAADYTKALTMCAVDPKNGRSVKPWLGTRFNNQPSEPFKALDKPGTDEGKTQAAPGGNLCQ